MRVVEADLAIKGCLLMPMDGRPPIEGAWLAVREGRIVYAGKPKAGTSIRAELVLSGEGKAVLPGLVNCHTHAPMTLLRGLAEDVPLDVWLREHIWPVEARMGPDEVYWGALLACIEMAITGTTCFCDMYFHEASVAEATLKVGLRAVLAPGILDAPGPDVGEKLLRDALDVFRRYDGAEGKIKVLLGPHAPYSCSVDLLEQVRDEARELGDRIAVMDDGKIITVGSYEELLAKKMNILSDILYPHNVLRCSLIEKIPEGLVKVRCRDLTLIATFEDRARFSKVVIPSNRVYLSFEKPRIRVNVFEAKIIDVKLNRNIYEVTLSVNETLLKSTASIERFNPSELRIGKSVYIQIPIRYITIL